MTAISVIIPALNEGGTIARCVGNVRNLAPDAEIIVADGASDDETVKRAAAAGATVCQTQRGRGVQLHAGAVAAHGAILVFLHADTDLPRNAFTLLRDAFADHEVEIGTFRLGFPTRHWLFAVYTALSRFDSILTTFGDQCIVVRSRFYTEIGGFPPWPLFEDVALLQEARRRTRIRTFPAAVSTSARRYATDGVLVRSVYKGWLVLRYLLGASPQSLAERYERSRRES